MTTRQLGPIFSRAGVARTLSAQLGDPNALRWHTFVVVSAQAGPPKTLTCNIDGGTSPVAGIRYDSSYSAAVAGDVLYGLSWQSMYVVLGKLA